MEDSLIEGDKVLLSKIHYGPIMPSSPKKLPWVNFFFYKLKYFPKWPYKRFSGLAGIKRNDIIIFTLYNYSANAPLIKRCIGLPGDTVQIINSLLFVNGKVYKNPSSVKYTYKIYSKEIEVLENALKEMSIPFDRIGKVCVKASVNSDQVFILNTLKYIDSLKLNVERESDAFPNNSNFTWTTNNLGPIIIPFKGMKVRIPSKVASLYKEIIDQENYNPLDSSHSDRIINTDSYIFKDNYYYVLGDNRDNSMDSRYFGFVPFKLIEGKATFILIPSTSRKRYMTTFFKLL